MESFKSSSLWEFTRKGGGGRTDTGYYFFLCTYSIERKPFSMVERARTGGKYRIVANEIRKPRETARELIRTSEG